jgi:hemerythrin-like domain-containing protein
VRDLERLKLKAEMERHSNESLALSSLAESLNEHFNTEEQLLFPVLSRCLGSGILDRLSSEHTKILTLAKKLNVQDRSFEQSVTHLGSLLRTHISMEENVLFWYLDVQLANRKSASIRELYVRP